MALSRLLRPLHTGASRMQSVIEQCHRPAHLHAADAADDSSVLNPAIHHNDTGKGSGHKVCDQHGYLQLTPQSQHH